MHILSKRNLANLLISSSRSANRSRDRSEDTPLLLPCLLFPVLLISPDLRSQNWSLYFSERLKPSSISLPQTLRLLLPSPPLPSAPPACSALAPDSTIPFLPGQTHPRGSARNIKIMRAECFGSIRRHRFLSAAPSRAFSSYDGGGGEGRRFSLAAMQISEGGGCGRGRGGEARGKKLRQSAKRSEERGGDEEKRRGHGMRAVHVSRVRVRVRTRVSVARGGHLMSSG